jgi:hypothetical protein
MRAAREGGREGAPPPGCARGLRAAAASFSAAAVVAVGVRLPPTARAKLRFVRRGRAATSRPPARREQRSKPQPHIRLHV